jgi:protein-L-isoaspartate(D-aspartate) O-methyltransferase
MARMNPKALVEEVIRQGVRDPRVLQALSRVPREQFVPPEHTDGAYENRPLPIGADQTISQPYIVALMTEALQLQPGDRVLEVGTGSGYGAAILAEMGAEVWSIERLPELAGAASERLARLGYQVTVGVGDGSRGWAEHSPFDCISVTAAGPRLPPALLGQLRDGGRLVMPVAPSLTLQRLLRVTREAPGKTTQEDLGPVRFVPLVGAQAWEAPGGAELPRARRNGDPRAAVPVALQGRNLYDCAALLLLGLRHPTIAPLVDRERERPPASIVPASDGERVQALIETDRRAARKLLARRFPDATPAELDDAWTRAVALEASATQVAARRLSGPVAAGGREADPRVTCPGFSEDVYDHADVRAMFLLRN